MIAAIAEQRILEAAQRGDFDDLPGAGQPLDLDDDRLVPEELRMAYRVLKNAGYVPPEVQTLKEIGDLERLVRTLEHGDQRTVAVKKLQWLRAQLSASRGDHLQQEAAYYDRLLESLAA